MNLLILSCGTRNLLVRYFRESGSGFDRVVGTDCSKYAPALYETDSHYITPRISDPGYMNVLLDICKKEDINAVLPLYEDELSLIAANRQVFLDNGILPVVSEAATIELCRDKYALLDHLRNRELPVLETCKNFRDFMQKRDEGVMDLPVFIKPNRGCGSVGAQKVDSIDLLEVLCRENDDYIIQTLADGEEFGADIFVDILTGLPVSVFVKKKLRMRAGETEKAISFKSEELFDLLRRTIASLPFAGPVDVDIFRVDGKFYISEINPRFGGGYPHAHKCGVCFPRLIAANVNGVPNETAIGQYESDICMLKYTDLLLVDCR